MAPQERPNGGADLSLMRPAAWGPLFHKEPYEETNRKAVLIHKLQARSLTSPLSPLPPLLQKGIEACPARRHAAAASISQTSQDKHDTHNAQSTAETGWFTRPQGFFVSEVGWPFLGCLQVHADNAASLKVIAALEPTEMGGGC